MASGWVSCRRRCVTIAPAMSRTRPVAASGTRMGAMPRAAGTIRPTAARTSATPMAFTPGVLKRSAHCMVLASFSRGWVSFCTPLARNRTARIAAMIQRAMFMRVRRNGGGDCEGAAATSHFGAVFRRSGVEEVMNERRQLINVAYRLLGSLADAEDVVQETYARWYALTPAQRDAIENPIAWMTTVASRVCLDLLGSARMRRERYVGEWLPEPVPQPSEWSTTGTPADPADRITLDESVNMAFLVVLESMTSAERVAFILHDVFRYSFAEVAEIVGRSPAACRHLASSARRRVGGSPPPVPPVGRNGAIVRDFKRAWEARDINGLIAVLDPNA